MEFVIVVDADEEAIYTPYFFGYKTEFFPLQNTPKNLDPYYKMNLDLWDC